MKKKILVMSLLAITIGTVFTSTAYAYYQHYETSISLGTGDTLVGKERNMAYAGQRIFITPTDLYFITPNQPVKLNIKLEQKSFLTWSEKRNSNREFSEIGKQKGVRWDDVGTGKTRYVFNTGTPTNPTGGITAYPVYIECFDE